jgi:DNA-binding transcriptional LysR family regulator
VIDAADRQALIDTRKFAEVGWSLYAARSCVARKPPSCDPCDVCGHDVVGFADAAARTPGARWLEANAGGTTVVFCGSSTPEVARAAKAGMGMAIVRCFTADSALERLTARVLAKSEVFLVTTLD